MSELTEEQQAELAELDEALEKFESQRRWSDYIRTLVKKAELVVDQDEKIALLSEAGTLFVERSSNQAEAIKCFEKVLDIDPENAEALSQLKDMYEKRRDWERLLGVMQREADNLADFERVDRYREMAQLASERLRKPEICIELWEKVRETEPEDPDAIENLASLYDRARDWEKLAPVLELHTQNLSDTKELKASLQKLGQIYGDKLENEDGAVRAFSRLLEIDPNDRRAQDQLKKRYIAAQQWDELETFFEQTGKWDELIRVFEREGDNKDASTEDRINVLFRAARLWEEEKQKPERAARAYEKVLSLDEENLRAAEALTPIYEDSRDAAKLANVYDIRAKKLDDDLERVTLYREAAALYEERLRDNQSAFDRYLAALRIDPTQEVNRDDVARLADEVDAWEQVRDVYSQAVGSAEPEDRIDLQVALGKVQQRLGETESALQTFRDVYELEPSHPAAIDALGELYRQTGAHDELIEIYDKRLELEDDPDARRTLAYGRARLLETELKQPEKAIDAYSQILAEHGDDQTEAYQALDRLHQSAENWAALAEVLERRIDFSAGTEEEIISLKHRLGVLRATRLSQKEEAVELFREVLSIDPDHTGASDELEKLLDDDMVGPAAAEILEPVYESRGQWDKLVVALDVRARAAGHPDDKLEFATRAAEIYGTQIGDARKSFDAYSTALRYAPESEDTLAKLEVLALDQERYEELTQLLREVSNAASDPDLVKRLKLKVANYQIQQLGQPEGAAQAYNAILERDPGDLEVLEALEGLYRQTENWAKLGETLRRRAQYVDDPVEQERVLRQVAYVQDEMLGDADGAITVYQEILDLDPGNEGILRELGKLYERQERWEELAANYEQQLEAIGDPDDRVTAMVRLAAIRETKLQDLGSAVGLYEEILETEPENDEAVAALERLIGNSDHRSRIAEILERVYRETNQFEKLVGVYEVQVAQEESPERKMELLHQIAELQELTLDDMDSAFRSFARALYEVPLDETTQQNLDRLASVSDSFEELAKIYERRVEEVEDREIGVVLHSKAASIRQHRLDDVPGAITQYQKVLQFDSENLEAATALEGLFQVSERFDDLASIYEKKATILHEPYEQKDYFVRAARVREDMLEQPDRALALYERAMEIDPEDLESLDRMVAIQTALGQTESLVETLSRKADVASDPDEQRQTLMQLGMVYENSEEKYRAVEAYERVLSIEPDDVPALKRLEKIHREREDWQELLSALERQADAIGDPDEAVGVRFQIAELWRNRLEDPTRAVELHRDILDIFPDHKASVEALAEMLRNNQEPLAAAAVLRPLYQQDGSFEQLVWVLGEEAAREEDPVRKVELLEEKARLHEGQLEDSESAFQSHMRALDVDRENLNIINSLERLAEDLGAWDRLAAHYDKQLEPLRNDLPDACAALALRAGGIYETRLANPELAIERYATVHEIDPMRLEAVEALDRLYFATEKWEELTRILETEVELAPTPEAMLDVKYRLGKTYENKLGDPERALDQYREIILAAPEHIAAVGALEALFDQGVRHEEVGETLEQHYRMQEDWDALLRVHARQLARIEDLDTRIQMMHRMAEIAEESADNHEVAFDWMQKALLEDPTHDHSLLELERLTTILEAWAQLAGTYSAIVGNQAYVAEHRLEMGRKLARLFEGELQDPQAAEQTYRYLLHLDLPDDREVLEALDRIYLQNGAMEALATTLARREEAAEFPDQKAQLAFRLGQVLRFSLGRIDEAEVAYQRVLREHDDRHAGSIRGLQAIYAHRQDWERLVNSFEQELGVVQSDQEQAEILCRMAHACQHTLGDLDRAADLWGRVLTIRGEDPVALNALGDVYVAQGKWFDVAEALDREANAVEDQQMRVAVLTDLARVNSSKLDREPEALEAWERAYDADPSRPEPLLEMAALHNRAGRNEEYVETLHRIGEIGEGNFDELISDAQMQLGYIYAFDLEQAFDGIEAYKKAADINPLNFDALGALEFVQRREGLWEDVVQTLERRVRVLREANEQRAQLFSIAQVWEDNVRKPDGATSAYVRILELEPTNDYAFTRLETLHAAANRHEELVGMYLSRAEIADSLEQQVTLLRKVARVYEEDIVDTQEAYDYLKIAWTLDYARQDVSRDLERVTRETNNWNDLLTSANQALKEVDSKDEKIAICLSCARWYGTGLGRQDYAIPYYEQIKQLDPHNVDSMRQLAELYHTTQQYDYERQMLEDLIPYANDAEVKAETYVKLGELCRGPLDQPDKSQSYFKSALAEDPLHIPALDALAELLRENEQWQELAKILERRVKAGRNGAERAETRLTLAELHELQLGDTQAAIKQLVSAREHDPYNLDAHRELSRLYTATEQWVELAEVLESEADLVSTERERIDVRMRLAEMFEHQFLKPEKAAERLEQVIEIDPKHEEALDGLGRLYRRLHNWDRLKEVYEQHIDVTGSREKRGDVSRSLGDLFAHELDDQERAIDMYLAALDLNDRDVLALDGLTRLYEKRGDHGQALEMMERVVDLSSDPDQQVDLRYRMGRLLDVELGDRTTALEHYNRALDLNPGHLPSLTAARKIHVDSGDWYAAATALRNEAQYQESDRLASQALVELARIHDERLDEHDKAIEVYEQALARDSSNEEAAFPLAVEYSNRERFGDAHPLLAQLFRRSDKREKEDQLHIATMFGRAAAAIGEADDAVRAYSKAYQIDPQDLHILMPMARAYFDAKDWKDAFKYYQMVLVHHRDSLTQAEATDVFYRLGIVKREQGEARKSLNMFEKALEEDERHRPTLEALIEIHEERKQWEQVIHYKRQLALATTDDEERFQLLEQVGDLWKDELGNQQKAIEAYTDATDVKPEEHRLLHKLLVGYQQTRQWDQAIEVIQQISDLADRDDVKAKYAYTIGVVYRDELKDGDRAIEKFDESLDLDWSQLKPFEALNRIYTQQKNWKGLERAFRKMLHRAVGKGNPELEFNLWHNLGVIYRDRQKNFDAAVESFKMATNVQPDNVEEHQILAELYASIPGRLDDAISEHQWLLHNDPYRVDSYRELYRLYFSARAYDKAWCLASALAFFGKADEEQRQFYEQYKPQGSQVRNRLDNTRWVKELFHEEESLHIGKLFEAIAPAVLTLRAMPDKKHHLLRKHQVDPATSTVMFAQTFNFASQVLALDIVPRLFLRPDAHGGLLHVAGSTPPATVCGKALLSGYTQSQLAFVVARHLSFYRGEHFIRTLVTSHSELKTLLLAALSIGGVDTNEPEVKKTAKKLLSKMQQAQVDAIRQVTRRFLETQQAADIKKWMQSVEITACRAGFLLCNDLQVAAQMVQALPPEGTSDLPAKDKIKEIALYSVSESYFRLREHLGLAIQVG